MAEQIKFGDRLFLAGEKVILDNGTDSPKLEARNGKLVIGYNEEDVQAKNHTVVIRGDLIVEGTTTTVNSEVVTLEDNVIEIGAASDNGQFVYGDPHDVVGVNMHLSETEIVGLKFKRTGAGWSEAPWSDYNFEDYASWELEPIANGDGTDRLILTNLASENFYSVNVDINGGEIDGTDIGLNSSAASVFSTMTSDLVDINGGTIDNTVIGSEISSSAIFTTMTTDEADINGGSINDTIIGFEVAASAVFTDVIADSISSDRLTANIANLGDFSFNGNVMTTVTTDMEIRSPGGISFYPDSDNSLPVPQGGEKIIWLRDGAKLVFEGTIPDNYEVKLQATDITADRDIIFPDESGTLALQEWTTREIDALTTDDIEESTSNLYYTDDRVQEKLGNVSGHILPDIDVTYDLGSPTNQFRSLYLSGQTIYLDGVALSLDASTTNLNVTNTSGDTQTFATETFVLNSLPVIPENVSAFINDASYITQETFVTDFGLITQNGFSGVSANVDANLINISSFINDSGYALLTDLAPVATTGSYSSLVDQPTLFSGNYNDLSNKPQLFSGSYNDLLNKPTLFDGDYNSLSNRPTIPTTISSFTNDSGYATTVYVDNSISSLVNGADAAFDTLKEIQDALATDTELANAISGLSIPSDVSDLTDTTNLLDRFSGNYNDLTNKPTIPVIPANVSYFANDAGYITSFTDTTYSAGIGLDLIGTVFSIDNTVALKSEIPTVPTNVSSFTNDAGYITSFTDTTYSAGSGLDLTGTVFSIDNTVALKSEIPTVPTTVSSFTNDIGYITGYTVTQADVTAHQASLSVTESQITDLNNYVKHSTDDHVIPNTDNTWDLGSTTNQWRTIYGHTVEATYADLAERYAADAPYDEGTVLVFGGEAEVTASTQDTDYRVAGIVSINPGLKLNSTAGNSHTHPYIALKGRIPCKVIGPVVKGDLLVTSATPGYARSCGGSDMGHAVLGKALVTDLSGGEKLIEVFVV